MTWISKLKLNNSGFLVKRECRKGEFIIKFITNTSQSYEFIAKKLSIVVFLTLDKHTQLPPLIEFIKEVKPSLELLKLDINNNSLV